MVNVGLRAFLWEQKSYDQKLKRELFNINGATYEGFRAYIRYIKDSGFSEATEATAPCASRQPSLPEAEEEPAVAAGISSEAQGSGEYCFSEMERVFDQAHCAVTLVKFGRFSSEVLAFAAADGTVYIGSTTGQEGIRQVLRGHSGRVADLDWSQENAFLLTCGQDGELRLWDAAAGNLVRRYRQGAQLWACPLTCCRFHPVNQNLLFAGTAAGDVVILNSSTGLAVSRVTLRQPSALGGVGAACLEATATQLLVADSRGGLHLYSCLLHGGQLHPPPALLATAPPARGRASHEPCCMELVPRSALAHGPAALLVNAQGRVLLYAIHEKGQRRRLELVCEAGAGAQSSHKARAALAPGAHAGGRPEVVAVGGMDCRVHLLDISGCCKGSPAVLAKLKGHPAPVLDVSWSYDESLLASCDAQGVVIVWKRDAPPAATASEAAAVAAAVAAGSARPVGEPAPVASSAIAGGAAQQEGSKASAELPTTAMPPEDGSISNDTHAPGASGTALSESPGLSKASEL